MTDQDKVEFAKLCALMSQAFDKPMSKALIGVYFDGLKDFDIEQISAAVNKAVQIKAWLPRVAELRQLIEGAVEDRAAMAWAAFLEAAADGGRASVQFADYATATAMDAVFGGWVQACRLLSAGNLDERGRQVSGCSDEMVASYQKQFARQYVAALHGPREVSLYRPGLSEMSMREGGGSWSLRIPTLKQPVIFVGDGRIVTLQLTFDVAQGYLTDESLAIVNGGWARAVALAGAEMRQLKASVVKALPPAPSGGLATQEEVDEINAAIRARGASTQRRIAGAVSGEDLADGSNFEAGN